MKFSNRSILVLFLIIILLRPIIDILYSYKFFTFNFTFLQIFGILLFITSIIVIYYKRKTLLTNFNTWEKLFFVWGAVVVLNSIFIFTKTISIESVGLVIKLTFPFYLYLFIKSINLDVKKINFLFYAFLISALIPFLIIFYEIINGPISFYYNRGIIRYQGLFAGTQNYSIYFLNTLLVVCYLALRKNTNKLWIVLATVLFLITLFSLEYLSHLTTYIVYLFFLVLFTLFLFKINKKYSISFILLIFFVSLLIYIPKYETKIKPLFNVDIKVMQKEVAPENIFNGRGAIWERKYNEFTSLPLHSKLFGANLSVRENKIAGLTAGTHNDFIRIIFISGILGLLLYLLLISKLIFTMKNYSFEDKFLVIGTIGYLLLYSVALTPTFYYPLMYLVLLVVAYINTQYNSLFKYKTIY